MGGIKSKNQGFTIVEMLVVVAIITILASLTVRTYATSQARGRDAERKTDISALYHSLEQYHFNNSYYPETFNASDLGQIDPKALVDPKGGSIVITSAFADFASAQANSYPSGGPNDEYHYMPIDCNSGQCRRYLLRSYLEDQTLQSHFERSSVN